MKKRGVIKYPKYIDTVSIYLGKIRDMMNAEMNEDVERFKRGELSELVNILGVKGELIAQHYLFTNNIKYRSAKLIDARPVKYADIYIDNIFIDVKSIRTDATDLLVNKEAHENSDKLTTHYWFMQPLELDSATANFWFYSYEDVEKWNIKNVKYTDAYFMPLSNLIQIN